jgi:hypothetical protein
VPGSRLLLALMVAVALANLITGGGLLSVGSDQPAIAWM